MVENKWTKKVRPSTEVSASQTQLMLGAFFSIGVWSGVSAFAGGVAALPYAILAFVTFYLAGWVVALLEWVIEANKVHKESLIAV